MKIDPMAAACDLLRDGRYAEGWRLYETRRSRFVMPEVASLPEWRGGPVGLLLVLGEQGLGDQIQFFRFVLQLKAQARRVVLLVMPPLVRLFASAGVETVAMGPGARFPKPDAWVYIGSLPGILGVELSNLSGAPYLPTRAGGSGMGIMWRGNPAFANDAERSMPLALGQEMLSWPEAQSLAPEDTGARDLYDTARIIDGLRLVVTVDTAVAHLAGAMGKRCLLMLPFVPDWRWMRDRSDSPWYPSMRLFRQPTPGDWASVVDQVRIEESCRVMMANPLP